MTKATVFILALVTMNLSCIRKAEGEKFLIPSGYKGRIIVFFNQSKGSEKKYVDNTRIYQIPPSGILLTQFEENPGYQSVDEHEIAFVCYNEFSKEDENIPLKPLHPDPDKIYVFYGKTGEINDYPYYACIIDKPTNIQNYFVKNNQGFNVEPKGIWDTILAKAGLRSP
jgi:hypothetical protein